MARRGNVFLWFTGENIASTSVLDVWRDGPSKAGMDLRSGMDLTLCRVSTVESNNADLSRAKYSRLTLCFQVTVPSKWKLAQRDVSLTTSKNYQKNTIKHKSN